MTCTHVFTEIGRALNEGACPVCLNVENAKFRDLLFLGHGCFGPALYGDDGEMQDKSCGIDFKRDSASDIETRIRHRGMAQLTDVSQARAQIVRMKHLLNWCKEFVPVGDRQHGQGKVFFDQIIAELGPTDPGGGR